jgi:DNA-binding transcriptional LysR family regulator
MACADWSDGLATRGALRRRPIGSTPVFCEGVQMNIQQIVYFLVLSEERHFTRAAKRCGIAQPSLTNAIRALEAEFGAPLFHRRPKPRLSELGAAVKPDLQRALLLINRALTRARRGPRQSADMRGRDRRLALNI